MSAKSKIIGMILLLISSIKVTYANTDTCQHLADISPTYVQDALQALSDDVLGKPADIWTAEDFSSLLLNVEFCKNKRMDATDKSNVDYNQWTKQITEAARKLLPITTQNIAIMEAYHPYWNWGDIPSCKVILSWSRDPIWIEDNSEDIFGKSLADMTKVERSYLKGFIDECTIVLDLMRKQIKVEKNAVDRILQDVKLSIQRENKASDEDLSQIAESLIILRKGKRIPLAYIGPTAQRWVKFANSFEINDTSMRVEDMINLSRWIEKVDTDKNKESPEILYARAVRDIVSRRMFSKR